MDKVLPESSEYVGGHLIVVVQHPKRTLWQNLKSLTFIEPSSAFKVKSFSNYLSIAGTCIKKYTLLTHLLVGPCRSTNQKPIVANCLLAIVSLDNKTVLSFGQRVW